MSEFGTENKESVSELHSRHKKEERELEGRIRALLKKASKKEKAATEAKSIQMKFDLKSKHNEEMERHEIDSSGIEEVDAEGGIETLTQDTVNYSTEAKKTKAARKKERQKSKNFERERTKAEIAANAGPSLREDELAIINGHLISDFLVVKDIISDGNCLYRALADQLEFVGVNGEGGNQGNLTFNDLRSRAADYLRTHSEEFAPFLGMEPTSQEFGRYCTNVERDAEWGGQIEIRALSACLQRQIYIYDASTPLIVMGDEYIENSPLKITYHRHYFALGEHYNSVKAIVNESLT